MEVLLRVFLTLKRLFAKHAFQNTFHKLRTLAPELVIRKLI
jgi:hypothetical protein